MYNIFKNNNLIFDKSRDTQFLYWTFQLKYYLEDIEQLFNHFHHSIMYMYNKDWNSDTF